MSSRSLRVWKIWSFIVIAVLAIWDINFWWFLIEEHYIGGDALNGYMSNGHYYLSTQTQPPYREVAESIWKWNYFHGISVVVLGLLVLPLGFFTFFVFHPALTRIRKAAQQHADVTLVESSGYLLYKNRNCLVIVGNLSPPIVAKLRMYPGGFILVVPFAGRVAIARSDIFAIVQRRRMFITWYDINIKTDALPSTISIASGFPGKYYLEANDIGVGQALMMIFPYIREATHVKQDVRS